MVLLTPSMASIDSVDPIADRLGDAMSVRVTVIASQQCGRLQP